MEKKRILICDDEAGIRESYKLILEEVYTLFFASDGIQAIEKFNDESYDLVILDIKIPKMDGLEVLKEIKKINPSAKVIIITGYQSASVAEEAIHSGANNYLVKPFERNQLTGVIQQII